MTGTNGKTTTAWLLRDLLSACAFPAAYLGTLGFIRMSRGSFEVGNTTPFAVDLANLIELARTRDAKALAMEVEFSRIERATGGTAWSSTPPSSQTSPKTISITTARWTRMPSQNGGYLAICPSRVTRRLRRSLTCRRPNRGGVGCSLFVSGPPPGSLDGAKRASLAAEAIDVRLDSITSCDLHGFGN